MSRTASAAIGLLVLVCGACAPRTSTAPDHGPHLDVIAVDLLTASGGYPARKRVLSVAEEQLVERCMTRHGQVYRPFVPPLVPGSDEERIVDLPGRRAEGYRLASNNSPLQRAAPNADQPEYQRALFGDDQHHQGLRLPNGAVHYYPTTGCLAESRATLYGDTLRWARIVSIPQIFDNNIRADVRNAPELAEANSRWASCMAAAGYPYSTPDAAIDDVSTAYRQHHPSVDPRNREIAVADGECALHVRLPSTELQLRQAKAQDLPPDQRRQLTELAAIHCAAYHNARRVTARENAPDC